MNRLDLDPVLRRSPNFPDQRDGKVTDVDPWLVANSSRLVRNGRGDVIFDLHKQSKP